jgi:hypothetical protein
MKINKQMTLDAFLKMWDGVVLEKLGRPMNADEIRAMTADYPETMRAASAEPTTKVEKSMSKKVSFSDIMHTNPVNKVAKSADAEWDVTEFEIRDGQLVRVDPSISLTAPVSDDATRDPANRASNFLAPNDSRIVDRVVNADGSVTPLGTYDFSEPDITGAGNYPAEFQPLAPGEGEDLNPRAMYSPSQPGDRPQGAAPADMDADDDEAPMKSTKSIRLGSGYVFKRRIES